MRKCLTSPLAPMASICWSWRAPPRLSSAERPIRKAQMEGLSGRGAVVIGGGSGVGRSIALTLGAEGSRVLIGDIDGAAADETAELITAAGGKATAAQVDATDRDALAAVARGATAELGKVHILANTVGILF